MVAGSLHVGSRPPRHQQKRQGQALPFLLVPVVGLEPTSEGKKVFGAKGLLRFVLHFILHLLFFRKNITEIIVHNILYRGLLFCHDVAVYALDHFLIFVAYIVRDIHVGDV